MKALVRVAGGVALRHQPDPTPGPEDVVVAVHSCGICGSDVHAAETSDGRAGGIPGHEMAGTIAQLGSHVHGLQLGQRVAVNPLGGCGTCEWCKRELLIRCTTRPNLGLSAAGGLAEYVCAHQSQLFPLPESVPLEHGSRVEPLAVAVRAVREGGPVEGGNAIVYGVGPIGLSTIQALRAAGASTIVGVGRSSMGRREAASALGAEVVLDSRETDVAEYVSGRGIDVSHAYECSGDPAAIDVLSRAVRIGGTLVVEALTAVPVTMDLRRFVTKAQRMVSACAYGNQDFARSLELIASREVCVAPMISECIPLEAGPEAFVRLRRPGNLVSVLVQPWR